MPLDGSTVNKPFKTLRNTAKVRKSGGRHDPRSQEARRKETGEDFTPVALVNEILDKLPAEVWLDPEKTWFDPACGDGAFLGEVKRRLLDAGHSEENVNSRIFGIDIMLNNAIKTCVRLGLPHRNFENEDKRSSKVDGYNIFAVSENIVCADTLCHATPEKMSALFRKAHENFQKWKNKNLRKN